MVTGPSVASLFANGVGAHAPVRGWWRLFASLFLALTLAGCGGSKVLTEAEPFVAAGSLATASDDHLIATLDWVIFRDGPGTWASNVDWDEYLMRLRNLSGTSVRIDRITVFDSLGTRTEVKTNRQQLVAGARETRRRYNDNDLDIGASWRSGGAGRAVATSMSTGAVVGGATMSSMFLTVPQAAAVGAVAGGIVALPVLAVSGVERGRNHSEVDQTIKSRQTLLPVTLEAYEERSLHVFFPLTPSPRRLEIVYSDGREQHIVTLDTVVALQGLHLADRTATP